MSILQILSLKIDQKIIQEASFGQKSVLKAALMSKIQFSKPLNLVPIRSTSPHFFCPSGRRLLPKLKLSAPYGPFTCIQLTTKALYFKGLQLQWQN